MQMHTRINRIATEITGEVLEGTHALADGLGSGDLPLLLDCLDSIAAQCTELEDVVMDVDAGRRCLSVGRRSVYDERFTARERALSPLLESAKARERKRKAARIAIAVLTAEEQSALAA